MKFVSWNVNGLRACVGKDFEQSFLNLDADFFCLQETKMQAGQLDLAFLGYRSYWNYAEKKGYSGTAIYAKHEPLSVKYGMGVPVTSADGETTVQYDETSIYNNEGRMITLEYDAFYLVNVYVPNSQDGLKRLDYRMEWEDAFRTYITALDKIKPVVICGDLNVAHQEIDLKNPKTNRRNPGFTDEERAGFTNLLAKGFTDTFRHVHGDVEGVYSWWNQRAKTSKINNSGWRIDYWLVSDRLADKVVESNMIDSGTRQDHTPLFLEINL